MYFFFIQTCYIKYTKAYFIVRWLYWWQKNEGFYARIHLGVAQKWNLMRDLFIFFIWVRHLKYDDINYTNQKKKAYLLLRHIQFGHTVTRRCCEFNAVVEWWHHISRMLVEFAPFIFLQWTTKMRLVSLYL
jgi:hypothetical protein